MEGKKNKFFKFFHYLQKLDEILAKGKNILQLTEICSKYETEREKVQPFKAKHTAEENAKPAENQSEEVLKDFKEV